MCIVVVDDEPEVRELVQLVLEDEGYAVVSFGHPMPVEQFMETHEPVDLFLIDIMLPDMSGIALATRLEELGLGAAPKIAMSASPDLLRSARESNMFSATLEKPFDLDDMLSAIKQHTSG